MFIFRSCPQDQLLLLLKFHFLTLVQNIEWKNVHILKSVIIQYFITFRVGRRLRALSRHLHNFIQLYELLICFSS